MRIYEQVVALPTNHGPSFSYWHCWLFLFSQRAAFLSRVRVCRNASAFLSLSLSLFLTHTRWTSFHTLLSFVLRPRLARVSRTVFALSTRWTGLLGFKEIYWYSLKFTWFYYILLRFTRFTEIYGNWIYWDSLGFTGKYWDILGFSQICWGFTGVLLSFTEFCWVLLGCIGLYWVWLDFTGFYWVLLGFTGFYRVLRVIRYFFGKFG